MPIEALFSPYIQELEPYEAPDWPGLAAAAGVRPEELVRLDANESPYGPLPAARRALARVDEYRLYPDYSALEAAVACYAGVEAQHVVLTNGGDEAIELAVRLFVSPGEAAIICPPAFGSYRASVRAHRGQVLRVPRGDDFSLDVPGIEALLEEDGSQARPKLLFVTSPGNPDGQPIPLETVRRLLALPLAVVVDEAYVEFGGPSATSLLHECDNLLILRSFSKWAGLAGLRLGYLLAAPPVATALGRLRQPYSINAAAVAAAQATLEEMPAARRRVAAIIAERERLCQALATLPGIRPLPGGANFVFCRLEGQSGPQLARALAAQGILIRSFSDPRLADAVRITVGLPHQHRALLLALQALLDPDGAETSLAYPVPAGEEGPGSQMGPGSRRGPSLRVARVQRRTAETSISLTLALDGTGQHDIDTGLGFLDHMLAQLAAHGLFDLEVRARGDLEVDEHHTVEDVAIVLGQALDQALGQRQHLVRMGQAYAPLDEALARVVVDLSGRPYAVVQADFDTARLGAVGADLLVHFLETLAVHGRLALHAQVLYGRNDHHRAEALFKALGRALDAAVRLDPRREGVPSTKGVL
jgi:histidinol-phosphate aminotransferase